MVDDTPPMTSQRPYLLRALYEWIADNGMTPHVLVNAAMPGVRVPAHAVKDGRIVLNIAERAVAKLELGNEALRFTARFAGASQVVNVPLEAVIAIYARETGQGMALPEEAREAPADRPSLSSVDASGDMDQGAGSGDDPDPGQPPPSPPAGKRGNHLRIVK